MTMIRIGWSLCLFFVAATGGWSPVCGQDAARQNPAPLGGQPVAAARRTAIDARPFHRPLDARRIRQWMQLASQCTMDEFQLFLAPLTEQEAALQKQIEKHPAPIVNRLHFVDLRGVLKHGGLTSLYVDQEAKHPPLTHTTPQLENKLFGAYDCVFASVGPPHGTSRYGDVVIRLKDTVRENGWATPFSGMHFLWAIRGQNARKMQSILAGGGTLPEARTDPLSLGFDDRLAYSHYIVTENHWNRALAYQAILVLRGADDSAAGRTVRARFGSLLSADAAGAFWATFIPPLDPDRTAAQQAAQVPFGYLEGKLPQRVSIDDFTAIEVPAERLEEVRGWPEARRYLGLIRARPAGVP